MKNSFFKLVVIVFVIAAVAFEAKGQEISAILNALQERNDKVEELREKRFNSWKELYKKWSAISPILNPGEPGWISSVNNFYADIVESENSFNDCNLAFYEYSKFAGGFYNISREEGGKRKLYDHNIPVYHFFLQFSDFLVEQGAPAEPSPEAIVANAQAYSYWSYELLVWVGEHISELEYEKQKISWPKIGGSSLSEAQIQSMSAKDLQTLFTAASLHFDRLKVSFVNLNKSADRKKCNAIEAFDEITMPSFGVLKLQDLASFARAIMDLHTLKAYLSVDSVRYMERLSASSTWENDVNMSDVTFTNSPEPINDFRGAYLFDGFYPGLRDATDYMPPHVFVHFNYSQGGEDDLDLKEAALVGIRSEVRMDFKANSEMLYSLLPGWGVDTQFEVYVSVDCEAQKFSFPGFKAVNGWEKVDYRSATTNDYRNGYFSSGLLLQDPQVLESFTSVSSAVWIPNFANTGLDGWESQVVTSPGRPGDWSVLTHGPYRFVLDLGRGSDLRASGALVIDAQGLDLAFRDSLRFIGSGDAYQLTFDDKVEAYPVDLKELNDSDSHIDYRDFYKAWNKPKLTKIVGKELEVSISYPDVLHTRLSVKRLKGGEVNVIDIYNEQTKSDITALPSDGLGKWTIKESLGLQRSCALEYLDVDTAKWKLVTSTEKGSKTSTVESSHDGTQYTHKIVDFDGVVTTVKDKDYAASIGDVKPWLSHTRISESVDNDGAESKVTYTYNTHTLNEDDPYYDEDLKIFSVKSAVSVTEGQTTTVDIDDKGRMTKSDPPGQAETTVSYSGSKSTYTETILGAKNVTEVNRSDMFNYETEFKPAGADAHHVTTKLHESGLKWQTKSVKNSTTGILTTYDYTLLGEGALEVVVSTGIGTDTVTNGTSVTTKTNKEGYLILRETKDIQSGTVLSRVEGSDLSSWGQPQTYTNHLNEKVNISYDADTRLASSYQDSRGLTTNIKRDDPIGRVTEAAREGITSKVQYGKGKQTATTSGSGIKQNTVETSFNQIRLTGITSSGAISEELTISDVNGSSSYKNLTRGTSSSVNLSVDGIPSGISDNSLLSGSNPTASVVGGSSGITTTSKAGVYSNETTVDGMGFPVDTVIPDANGSSNTIKRSIEYLGDGATRVVSENSFGQTFIEESLPYSQNGSIVRSGIDVNGNGSLGSGDRYTESSTVISSDLITTTVKATRSSGFETIATTTYQPSTGLRTSLDSDGEMVTTRPVRSNGAVNSIITESNRGNQKSVVSLDANGLPVSQSVSGDGIPATTTSITRRANGTVSKTLTNIAGIGNYGSDTDEAGYLEGLTHPLKNYSSVSQSHSSNGTLSTRFNDGSGVFESSTAVDGSASSVRGPDMEGFDTSLGLSGGGYSFTMKPDGGATTTTNTNPFGMPATKRYNADSSSTVTRYYGFGGIKDITTGRGAKTMFGYSANGAKDLVSISYNTVTSNGKSISTPGVNISPNPFGAPDTISDGSGIRKLAYAQGRNTSTAYESGALAGYQLVNSFDAQGRLKGVVLQRGGSAVSRNDYNYVGGTQQVSSVSGNGISAAYTRNNGSQLVTSVSRGGVSDTYQYGQGARLAGASSGVGAGSGSSQAFSFYASGKRKSDGRWNYFYDGQGHLIRATHPEHGTFLYNVDRLGRRSYSATAGADFNNLNQPTKFPSDGSFEINISAHHSAKLWVNGTPVVNPGAPFKYRVQPPSVSPSGSWQIYEVVGRIPEGGDVDPADPNQGRLDAVARYRGFAYSPPSEEQFTYDNDGNRTSSALCLYRWDASGRLVEITTRNYDPAQINTLEVPSYQIKFAYDSQGRRYKKTIHKRHKVGNDWATESKTCWFLYDGWSLLYERHEPGMRNVINTVAPILERRYTWGLDLNASTGIGGAGGAGGLISYTETVGGSIETYVPTYDGGGHVTGLIRQRDRQVVASYTYGPFGEQIEAKGEKAASNPWRYATKYYDPDTQLYYFGYRYYHPATGSWLSREPLGEEESMNLYAYCHNDPINKVDVLGLAAIFAFDGTNLLAKHQSNVRLLLQNYQGEKFYKNGVGTEWHAKLRGGAFGRYGKKRVKKALKEMEKSYAKGERVFDVIGFSRGAALARDFVNEATEHFKKKGIDIKFRFVGLFDTVPAFGFSGNDKNWGFNFHMGENVETAAQVHARDERRFDFMHEPLKAPPKGSKVKRYQVIFKGDHSDIGGGWALLGMKRYKKPGAARTLLSRDSLWYIYQRGKDAGVPWKFPTTYIKNYDKKDEKEVKIVYENSRRSHGDFAPGFKPLDKGGFFSLRNKFPLNWRGTNGPRDYSKTYINSGITK